MYDTTLKEAIVNNEIVEDKKNDYETFRIQAEKIIVDELYNSSKPKENENSKLIELVIKRYYFNGGIYE